MNGVMVHPTALVESEDIGEGSRIWAFVHVMPDVRIGQNCNIGGHSFIESGVVIGDDVTIKNGNMIWEGVIIESGAFIGPGVVFTNDLYPRSPRLQEARDRYCDKGWLAPTVIRHGASLGAGCVVLAGTSVGEYAMVAAAAVVTRDVLAHTLVKGMPARPAGWVCRCGRCLEAQDGWAACSECGWTLKTDEVGLWAARSALESSNSRPSDLRVTGEQGDGRRIWAGRAAAGYRAMRRRRG